MLQKYTPDPTHIIEHETFSIREDLYYEEISVKILARYVKQWRSKKIPLVKVLRSNHQDDVVTLEHEEDVKES